MKKLLLLSANPKNTTQLRVDEEMREIREGLRRSKQRENFVIETALAVRYRDIRRAILDHEPNIVHFSGHGVGEEGLIFEDETGQSKLVEADALANLFKLFADSIECIVLNACYSEVQAKAIAQYIPYVVGMDKAIGDKAAIEFAIGFYDTLGAGRTVKFAYELGCNSIEIAGIPENSTPQLLSKPDFIASQSSSERNIAVQTDSSTQGSTIYGFAPGSQESNLVSSQNIQGNAEAEVLKLWKEKLSYFYQQEAIASDPSTKFKLRKQIEEYQKRIREIEGNVEKVAPKLVKPQTTTDQSQSQIQIFIAHANEDKPLVRELYAKLVKAGYKPWFDEEDLLPGQNWREEIPKALKNSDLFIACLSSTSINKRGYIQGSVSLLRGGD
jgi:hypothetical protein